MVVDLSPLEQAAARVGLPGLKARIVPHDRRRGWWFRWGGGELLVSDRVIDRCTPQDASALIIDEVFRRQRQRAIVRLMLLVLGTASIAALVFVWTEAKWSTWLVYGFVTLSTLVSLSVARASCAQLADDDTVRLLDDATPLVRGLNGMDFEEIHLAGKVLPARPDLHRRAERLVRLHRLCEAQPPA